MEDDAKIITLTFLGAAALHAILATPAFDHLDQPRVAELAAEYAKATAKVLFTDTSDV